MPDGLLGVLKLCLLALLYLFFIRVLWAVGTELRGPRTPKEPRPLPEPKLTRAARKAAAALPSQLVLTKGSSITGSSYDLGDEMTIGRAAGCAISIEDSFASQVHARVFTIEGNPYVEDLGSTTGTFVNGQRIGTSVPLHRTDTVQIGSTALEVR